MRPKIHLLTPVLFGKKSQSAHADKILGYSPIAYWPLWETSGGVAYDLSGNGFNGAYTGVTLGDGVSPDGSPCPLFDGVNDYVDVYSNGFRDAFNGAEGTVSILAKVFNAGVWTDGTGRRHFQLRADIQNLVSSFRPSSNSQIKWDYEAGDTQATRTKSGLSSVDWVNYGLTWSKSAGADGEAKAFYNGVQEGATMTSLGVWVGNLVNTHTIIGAFSTTPNLPWYGWISHPAVFDSAKSPAEMLDMATV